MEHAHFPTPADTFLPSHLSAHPSLDVVYQREDSPPGATYISDEMLLREAPRTLGLLKSFEPPLYQREIARLSRRQPTAECYVKLLAADSKPPVPMHTASGVMFALFTRASCMLGPFSSTTVGFGIGIWVAPEYSLTFGA
jgi:hypothetical protein